MDRLGELKQWLGERARINEWLGRYATARIGGTADLLVEALSANDLAEVVLTAWRLDIPTFVLGAGANVLISDSGIRGLTIINKARKIEFVGEDHVMTESGVVLPTLARECNARGLAGFEWAVGVPGTVGGAVVGNAGAHNGDTASVLKQAWVLEADGKVHGWQVDELAYTYRSSRIKEAHTVQHDDYIVLKAEFALKRENRVEIENRATEFNMHRRQSQPRGASIGSMFKNPAGDTAGRLIEAAGLKGTRFGQVEISKKHANFFVNLGGAKAQEVMALINFAKGKVQEKYGIILELEVEKVGDWR